MEKKHKIEEQEEKELEMFEIRCDECGRVIGYSYDETEILAVCEECYESKRNG